MSRYFNEIWISSLVVFEHLNRDIREVNTAVWICVACRFFAVPRYLWHKISSEPVSFDTFDLVGIFIGKTLYIGGRVLNIGLEFW